MEQSFCKTAFSLYFSGQITLDYCVQFFYILEGPNNTGELGEKKKSGRKWKERVKDEEQFNSS